MLPLSLVAIPALLGAAALLVQGVRGSLALLIVGTFVHAGLTASLWVTLPAPDPDFFLGIDATSLVVLSVTSTLFVVASLYAVPYLRDGTHDPHASPRRFVPCLLWFLAATSLVTVTQHLALMWAAVEATTLASAPLVYFYRRRAALEAAWKYLLICSCGIALALLGVFFLGIAASAAEGADPQLTLGALTQVAPQMSQPWLRAAFVLALVGYGTKMGLAPLHTWLPDTHSQAPSPVSALLSGALLNCAFLAILRFYEICLAAGDAAFARTLLLTLGFLSMAVASALMVGQRDYKRLFAYSSIENMGVIAAGIGLGGAASFGALLHAVNHSLCKAGLFFLAGNVLRAYGTTQATAVRGLSRRLPATALMLAALWLAIGGAPPFGPFISELVILRAAIDSGHVWLGALFVTLLAVAFLGLAGTLLPMLQGGGEESREGTQGLNAFALKHSREPVLALVAPLAMVAASLMLGLYVPPPLADLLSRAARLLGG
jgi:hydrogenase-4 component F